VRIAIVTSQFPVAGDPTRGRPLLQTIEALARLGQVQGDIQIKVFVPNARYPQLLQPRSYNYLPVSEGAEFREGLQVEYLTYPTLPWVGRLTNGHAVARALGQPLTEFAPDIVLTYWLYPDAFGAAQVAARIGVPCISGARGSDLRARDRVSLALARSALAKSAHVLTVSEDLKRIAVRSFGVSGDCATAIANGCNVALFRRGDRLAARRALGLPAADRLVLYVGRLVAAKGLRELLRAWANIAQDDSRLRLAFVGDGVLHSELASAASAAGMANRVVLPGSASPEQVARWMQACDVFCLPSHSEGYPNVLVEALACGRPIVGTAVGGILEIVDDDNGLLTPVGDVARLSEALRSALNKRWDEAALSRRFARSWDDVAAETLEVCHAVIGRSLRRVAS